MADLYITQKLVNFNIVGIPLSVLVEEAVSLVLNQWLGKDTDLAIQYLESKIIGYLDSYLFGIFEEYAAEQQLTDDVLFVNEFISQVQADVVYIIILIYNCLTPMISYLSIDIDGQLESIVAEEFDSKTPFTFNILLQFSDAFYEENKYNIRM